MSTRRVVAAVLAAIVAVVAALLVVTYVRGADARAARALNPVPVLVVVTPVAKGTSATDLGKAVEVREIPRTAVASDAVANIDTLGSKVASVDLVPGEQVLSTRFVEASALTTVSIPKGMQEVSIMLSSQRVYGGAPKAGDTVGVFLSAEGSTKLVLNRVLITKVVGGPVTPTDNQQSGGAAQDTALLLTLALNTHDAERVVWTAENGSIWMSLQNKDTDTNGSAPVTAQDFAL